jgi:hypothetical protein
MKAIYLSAIAGLTICFAFSAQAGPGSKGQHRSRHQSHHQAGLGSNGLHRSGRQFPHHGQHHFARERSHTYSNLMKRERERERETPNGVPEEQRTNGAGDTQTRSQEGTTQPNP